MIEFHGKRVTHEYTQTNAAPPEQVFPLLCPVREADWVPGWEYRLIYSESGVAELGCVFLTPNQDGSETTWVVTEYDSATFRVSFAWVNAGLVAAQISIWLEANSINETLAHIRYTYTGLSSEGNREVERYDEKWFRQKMQGWETAINYYLRTGTRIDTSAWE
ncbi:MAG: hypothetical protein WB952_25435 [Terriglobales bacterium]